MPKQVDIGLPGGARLDPAERELLQLYAAQRALIERLFKSGELTAMPDAQRELSRISLRIDDVRRKREVGK